MLELLRKRFIPVAVDQHIHRRLHDAEGKLFADVLKQAGRGLEGRSQGVFVFTAAGKLLAFQNVAEAEPVKRVLRAGLARFDARTAEAVKAEKAAAPLPSPPAGGLVLRVAAKVLGGYEVKDERTRRYAESVAIDRMWLRKDEAAALVRGELPDSVKKRLVRYHLIDNTRGEPPLWGDDEIKKLDLRLEDGKLRGTVHLETKSGDRRYRAELLGFVEVKGGKVVRLDLLARGQFRGEGTFTRGAPRGDFPFAVAFTLSEAKAPEEGVPPQGARGWVEGYLR